MLPLDISIHPFIFVLCFNILDAFFAPTVFCIYLLGSMARAFPPTRKKAVLICSYFRRLLLLVPFCIDARAIRVLKKKAAIYFSVYKYICSRDSEGEANSVLARRLFIIFSSLSLPHL